MSKQAILANYPDAARWAFGDGPELADELLQLVLSGEKDRHLQLLCELSPGANADDRRR